MPDPFDRLLERTMKAGARTAEPCPPADTLAAFVDGSLSAAERAAIERHAADCQVCAEHLALLSSLEPVSSSDPSTSRSPRGGDPGPGWYRSPQVSWSRRCGCRCHAKRRCRPPRPIVSRSAARSAPEPPKPARRAAQSPRHQRHRHRYSTRSTPATPSVLGGVAPKVRKQSLPAKVTCAADGPDCPRRSWRTPGPATTDGRAGGARVAACRQRSA